MFCSLREFYSSVPRNRHTASLFAGRTHMEQGTVQGPGLPGTGGRLLSQGAKQTLAMSPDLQPRCLAVSVTQFPSATHPPL